MPPACRRLTVTSLLLLATAAAAEPAPRASPAVELARQAVSPASYEAMLSGTAKLIVAQITQSVEQAGGTVSPELEAAVLEAFRRLMPYQEMLDLQAGILTKHFTAAEMGEIAAFYRTPTGLKALRVMPEASQDAMSAFMTGSQRRMAEMMEGLKPYIHMPEQKGQP